MQKQSSIFVLRERNVCQRFAVLKTGKRHPFYVFSIQSIVFFVEKGRLPVLGFSQKLANVPPGKMLANVPPQTKLGG